LISPPRVLGTQIIYKKLFQICKEKKFIEV